MDFVKAFKDLSDKFKGKKKATPKKTTQQDVAEDGTEVIDVDLGVDVDENINIVDDTMENIDEVVDSTEDFNFNQNQKKKKSLKEHIEALNFDSEFFKKHKIKIIAGVLSIFTLLGLLIAKPYLLDFYKNYTKTNTQVKTSSNVQSQQKQQTQPMKVQEPMPMNNMPLDEKKNEDDLLKQYKNAPEQKNSDKELLNQFKNEPTPVVNENQNGSNITQPSIKDGFNGVNASLEGLKNKPLVDKSTDDLSIKTNTSSSNAIKQIASQQPDKQERQVDVMNNTLKAEAKSLLNAETRETSLESAMIKEDLKNNQHIQNSLNLMNKGRDVSNIDAYTLVSEDFTKLEEYEKLIDKRQQFMAKMSTYLKQRQEYIETLKAFENITSVNSQETQNKKIKEQVLSETNEVIAALNTQINSLNGKISSMEKEQVMKTKVKEPEINPEEARKRQEAKSHEEEGLLLKRELEENLKNINIFKMNNNLIIVVNSEDQDMIYKEGDFFGSGFRIKEITESVISFEKDGRVYYHNLANSLKQKAFTKVTVKLPGQVKEDLNYDEKELKKGADEISSTSSVKEYQTAEDKKKAYADKLLNSKTTSSTKK